MPKRDRSLPHPESKCALYLESKRRWCMFDRAKGSQFCGNHLDAGAGVRVPCPADPKHTVLASELAAHLVKCPASIQSAKLKAACYYNHDINAGSEWEPDPKGAAAARSPAQGQGSAPPTPSQGGPQEPQGLAAARAAAALQLGQQGWEQLLRRLTAVHDQAGILPLYPPTAPAPQQAGSCQEPHTRAQPALAAAAAAAAAEEEAAEEAAAAAEAAEAAAKPAAAAEAAAAAAHEAEAGSQGQVSTASGGPLVEAAGPEWHHTSKTRGGTSATLGGTLVEVGAGKAGLACMVGGSVAARQACGVSAVLLMDNRAGFQAKADRWMRDLPLQRLTLDLKDFAIWRAPLVAASPPPAHPLPPVPADQPAPPPAASPAWAVVGKHLCGAATDMALRACLAHWEPCPPPPS
ncbi:hypothetical protein V8C86DRAFT_3128079, partial [Haematococcus lacustris]